MDLISVKYAIFIITGSVLFSIVSNKYRKWLILFLNILFYFLLGYANFIIYFSLVLSTFAGGKIISANRNKSAKLTLLLFIGFNIAILAFFKYQSFIYIQNSLLFPLGLSFLSFRSISYLVESYRKKQEFDFEFKEGIIFLSYFPTIRSGPIEKPFEFINQLRNDWTVTKKDVFEGINLIIFGLFKKLVIADRLSFYANTVFDNPQQYKGFSLLIASVVFSLQIYYDFSAYTDIALGTSRFFGLRLTANFNRPYFSKNISEFWRRWHISLSNWLRDYLFFPIADFISMRAKWFNLSSRLINILIYSISISLTMLIAGIWHGNGVNFIIWGLLFALYLSFSVTFKKQKSRLIKILHIKNSNVLLTTFRVLFTFSLVTFAWIFFRANNLDEAIYVIGNSLHGITTPLTYFAGIEDLFSGTKEFGKPAVEFFYAILMVIICEIIQYVSIKDNFLIGKNVIFRWSVYFFIIFSVLLFSVSHVQGFLYYKF